MAMYGAMSLLAGSCWMNDLLVKNLDTIVEYKVSENLELFYGQKEKLEKDTSNFLNGLKSEAPKIKTKLNDYSDMAKNGIDSLAPKEVEKEMKFWQQLYIEKTKDVIEKHMDYIAGLSEGQQEVFFEKAKKKNEELEEKIKENDVEKIAEGYEYAFGELSSSQLKVLKSKSDFFKKRSELHLKRRLDYQKELKKLFEEKAPVEKFQEISLNNLEQRFSDSATKEHAEIFATLAQKADSEGKKNLKENIEKAKGWVETFVSTTY